MLIANPGVTPNDRIFILQALQNKIINEKEAREMLFMDYIGGK